MIRLALRCRLSEAEEVLAELLELAPGGVEEVTEPDGRAGVVEYAVYGARGELPDLGTLTAAAGEGLVEVRTEEVADDWEERWKRFYYPVLVGGRLYVRPPWEQPAQRGGVVEIVIDPGRAFGTGTHPTTRMCLELLLEAGSGRRRIPGIRSTAPARSFCDLGCGSGVLAIAAAKLGFRPALAADVDGAALDETARNARANYVDVEVRRLDLREDLLPAADVVAANLTARLLDTLAHRWSAAGERPGTVIASGFLEEEADDVSRSLAGAGLAEARRLASSEWAAMLAARRYP